MNEFLLLVLLAATTYTIGRVIALDGLFEEWRDAYLDWVTAGVRNGDPGWQALPVWRKKLATVVQCPHCCTAYTAAGSVIVADVWFVSMPMPVLWWFGAWTGGLVFWAVIDHD